MLSTQYMIPSRLFLIFKLYGRRDSNPQHSEPESDALSIELRPHIKKHFLNALRYYSRDLPKCKGDFSLLGIFFPTEGVAPA